jgi:hypothetical protein
LRITALLLAAGLVLLAAGCGDSKKTAATPTNTTGATGKTGATGLGPTGAGPAGSTGGFASAKNCLAFAGLAAQIASAMAPASADNSSIDDGTQYLQALADAAPSEIKGDLQAVATALGSYVQAVKDSGYDLSSKAPPSAAQLIAIASAAKVFNTAKLQQATQHLRTWEQQNCK